MTIKWLVYYKNYFISNKKMSKTCDSYLMTDLWIGFCMKVWIIWFLFGWVTICTKITNLFEIFEMVFDWNKGSVYIKGVKIMFCILTSKPIVFQRNELLCEWLSSEVSLCRSNHLPLNPWSGSRSNQSLDDYMNRRYG